uniref:Vacuolar protein sorting-associated protein 1-like n=1 Tax=Dermatophagoides pteronyssinus TaxID=6956 RepID=A0A6P6XPU5_DERPT|nr:vacuolar protein sorting-associated protein 1-like [Dermatophagoides pteronyssinus]
MSLNLLDQLNWHTPFHDFIENIPRLVVVGAQSVGKTSILEKIIGHSDVMPKGNGMVTRQPVSFRLYYEKSIDFYAVLSLKVPPPSYDQIQKDVVDAADNRYVTDKWLVETPLFIKIYSRKCPNLALVDLPGLIRVPDDRQPKDLDEQIKKLIMSYITQSNTVIVAISPANQDIANSDSLKLAREVDPTGNRTVGVISKYDLVGSDEIIEGVIKGKLYKLRYGYIPIIISNEKPAEEEKTIKNLITRLEVR